MSFGLKTHHLTSLSSYAKARAYYEKIKPWRGETDPSMPRPLTKGRKRHLMLCPVESGTYGHGYAVRYHDTDVVTHYESGWATVTGYPSRSTEQLAWRFSPVAGYFHLVIEDTIGLYCLETWDKDCREDRLIFFRDSIAVREHPKTGKLEVSGDVKVARPVADTSTQRKVLAAVPEYRQFSDWARAMSALNPDMFRGWRRLSQEAAYNKFAAGPTEWPELLEGTSDAKGATKVVREALLWRMTGSSVPVHHVPVVTNSEDVGYANLESIRASCRKYGPLKTL